MDLMGAEGPDFAEENLDPANAERAVECFLRQTEKCLRDRDREKAQRFLQGAAKVIVRLDPALPARTRWEERARCCENFIKIIQLFRKSPSPNKDSFRIFHRNLYSPEAYKLVYDYAMLLRRKVFTEELRIPAQVEGDERDDVSFHGMVFRGDAACSYARMWVHQGPNGMNWAVLDRICTLEGIDYSHRKKGKMTYLLNNIVYYLKSRLAEKLNIHILVMQIPVRSTKLIDNMLRKGFNLVMSREEYQQAKANADLPLIYLDENRVRINMTDLYFPLPGAPPEAVERDLLEIKGVTAARVNHANDPVFRSQAQSYMQNFRNAN